MCSIINSSISTGFAVVVSVGGGGSSGGSNCGFGGGSRGRVGAGACPCCRSIAVAAARSEEFVQVQKQFTVYITSLVMLFASFVDANFNYDGDFCLVT